MKKILKLTATAAFICGGSNASAQLQVPNALIHPKDTKSMVSTPDQRALPPPPPSMGSQNTGGGESSRAIDSTSNEVGTVKNAQSFFGGYYVSAIIGEHAILRRQSTGRSSSASSANTSTSGGTNSASSTTVDPLAFSRSESIELINNIEVRGVVSNATLKAHVTPTLVTIVASKSGSTSKDMLVFSGGIESASTPYTSGIVLEKIDTAYKQGLLSAKTGSVSSVSSSSPGSSTNPQP